MQLFVILPLIVGTIILHEVEAETCLSGWTLLASNGICFFVEETLTASLFDARAACEAFSAPDSKLLLEENAIDVFNFLNDPTIAGRFRIEGYQRNIPTGTWNWYEDNPTSQPLTPQQTVMNTRDTFATLLIRLSDGVYFGNRNRMETNKYICQSSVIPTTFPPIVPTTTPAPTTTQPPTTTTPTTTTPTTTTPTTTMTTTTPTTTTPTTTTPTTTTPTTTTPTTTMPTTTAPTTFPPTTTTPTTTTPTTTQPTTTAPTTLPPTTTTPTTTTPTTTTPTTTTPTTTTPTTTPAPTTTQPPTTAGPTTTPVATVAQQRDIFNA